MNNAQLINQDSGDYEYYTQAFIIEAARRTMGRIDLDPACSHDAILRVKALYYYSEYGLERGWFGNVWLNHPFSREFNKQWIHKLVDSYQLGYITQACCICYASTSEGWFQPLFQYMQCWLSPRTNYLLPDGSLKRGVTKGSVVTYLGNNKQGFYDNFSVYGKVTVPYV